jgi:very-short-patch-repair endonuclease
MSIATQCDIECLGNELNVKKYGITRFLKKYFKENVDYTVSMVISDITRENSHGGNNRMQYTLSKECMELIRNSYNLKHRYVTKINTLMQTNIVMTLENSTIGFLCNCIKNITDVYRQYKVGSYFVDLYIPKINIVVECDEDGHKDRNLTYEHTREEFIKTKLGCEFIRFNPNDTNFDLSDVINKIFILLMGS